MKVWLDAQLPPALCTCLASEYQLEATALRDLGLRDARDGEIFEAACPANVVVMSKDADFAELVRRRGAPRWRVFGPQLFGGATATSVVNATPRWSR